MGTRDDIISAATDIMRTKGYASATTKEIARAAGYSEAALYKHFTDKTEIFLNVLQRQLPALGTSLDELGELVGQRTVAANLAKVAATAIGFYAESFPISASLFSSRALLDAHRERLAELDGGTGPRRPVDLLAGYLREEQRIGRVAREADPGAAAALLLGACFQQGFLVNFEHGAASERRCADAATGLVETLLTGLAPAEDG
ncbi:TetR/AcrR family transcriptional regulator [Saccharomonospora sp. NPDC006951]